MRRLVGLIVLLVLILGVAWLVRNDYNLNGVADLQTLFEPAEKGGAAKTPPEEVASAPAAQSPGAPEASQSGTGAEAPSGGPSEATTAVNAEPSGPEMAEPSESPTAAEPAVHATGGMAAAVSETSKAGTAMAPRAPAADTAVAEPTDTAEPAPPDVVVPSFDIVRVEPTGETVVAGVAEPQATVEVLDGPKPVATAEANKRGEWAMVLDKPLPPGSHDLAVRATSKDRSVLSDQRVAVSVPENADEQPLVVLNEPDAPSKVMQIPAEGTPAPTVAAASEPQQSEARPGSPPSAAETEVAAAPQPGPGAKLSPPSGEGEMAASEPEAPAAGRETPAVEAEVASAPTAVPSMPLGLPERAGAPSASDTAPESVETEVAALPAAKATPDASGKLETAAPSGSPSAEAGTETMATSKSEASTRTMTADAITTVSEQSASKESAVPAPTPTEMAAVPSVLQEEPAAAETAPAKPVQAPTGAKPGSPPVVEEPPPTVPKVGVTAVEAETNGTLYVAGTATTPEPVRVYVDDKFLGETTPAESGTWLLETTREMAPDKYTIRADQVDAESGKVVARAEVPFEREIDVATLKPVGESLNPGTAEVSGSVAGPMQVIIKRGDNLWRISREMYGHGIRYSTIYRANRDQIRNPNLIYPGQVFVLPAGDASWQN